LKYGCMLHNMSYDMLYFCWHGMPHSSLQIINSMVLERSLTRLLIIGTGDKITSPGAVAAVIAPACSLRDKHSF
jgi:hypothetical protein